MSKSTNFTGQPIFSQLIRFIDKSEVRKIAKQHHAERYVKKFNTPGFQCSGAVFPGVIGFRML